MSLCLLFHCLCETYDGIPANARELFVSVPDLERMIRELLDRDYEFGAVEGPSSKTVTITFDDGYHNNVLFQRLAETYDIPYIVFVSAYYLKSSEAFPWLWDDAARYSQMTDFDYYQYYEEREPKRTGLHSELTRPFTIEELGLLKAAGKMEIGCHGYYHQPLSKKFQKYLEQERDLSLAALDAGLGIRPRYFSLANGLYTKGVAGELLKTFDKLFTIEGIPFRPHDRTIHRLSLINPNLGGPLIAQIDKSLMPHRQIKRVIRTKRRMLV